VSDAPEPTGRRPQPAPDLVEYFVVVVPECSALAGVAPALAEMVETGRIRVLDVVVVERHADGGVEVLEIGDVEGFAVLRDREGDFGLLSENDVQLAARAVRPGEAGLVVVAEDRWAEELSAAARRVGGQIVAGERISPLRLEVVDEAADDDTGGR
jgi:hypothetical protein